MAKSTPKTAKRVPKPLPPLDLAVYKPSEVAALLRLDPRTVYAMIDSGTLPKIDAGRVIRIPGDAVRALLAGKKPAVSEGPDPDGRTGTAGD